MGLCGSKSHAQVSETPAAAASSPLPPYTQRLSVDSYVHDWRAGRERPPRSNLDKYLSIWDPVDPSKICWERAEPKIVALCKRLWPRRHLYGCRQMESGRDDHFVDIWTRNENGKILESYVLRVPKPERQSTVLRSVAVARHLRLTTDLPVPEVIFYDHTLRNPIRSPYVVQALFKGKLLAQVLLQGGLYDSQYRMIAESLARLYKQFQLITSPRAGLLTYDGTPEPTVGPDIVPIGAVLGDSEVTCRIDDGCVNEPGQGLPDSTPTVIDTDNTSIQDAIIDAFRRLEQQFPTDLSSFNRRAPVPEYAEMRAICREILDKVTLDDGFCLWPNYLDPWLIMIDDQFLEGKEVIKGIIDWRELVYVPRFVACDPPVWLWDPSIESHKEYPRECSLCLGSLVWRQLETPVIQSKRRLKGFFDSAAGEYYMTNAYDKNLVVLRTLFQLTYEPVCDEAKGYLFREAMEVWRSMGSKPTTGSDIQQAVTMT